MRECGWGDHIKWQKEEGWIEEKQHNNVSVREVNSKNRRRKVKNLRENRAEKKKKKTSVGFTGFMSGTGVFKLRAKKENEHSV